MCDIQDIELDCLSSDCPICLDKIPLNEQIKVSCCRQVFHKSCLIDFLIYSEYKSCSICRHNFEESVIPLGDFFEHIVSQQDSYSFQQKNNINNILHSIYNVTFFDQYYIQSQQYTIPTNTMECSEDLRTSLRLWKGLCFMTFGLFITYNIVLLFFL